MILIAVIPTSASISQYAIEQYLAEPEFWEEIVETKETTLYESNEIYFNLEKENNYYILEYVNSTFYFQRENALSFSFEIEPNNCSIDFIKSGQNKLIVKEIKYDKTITHKFNKSTSDFKT